MSQPRVSVIIPVFNGERFLARAIESALAQTSPPAEVIVVDDGSTDATPRIVEALPVAYLRQENQGPAAARNNGCAVASGDYLAFLDCDDVWLPAKLETQLIALQQDVTAGYARCFMRHVFEAGTQPAWFRREISPENEPCYTPTGWLIRREAWESVGPFQADLRMAEDVDWLARANDFGIRCVTPPEVLVLKLIHENNLTADKVAIRRDVLRALRFSLDRRREAKRDA